MCVMKRVPVLITDFKDIVLRVEMYVHGRIALELVDLLNDTPFQSSVLRRYTRRLGECKRYFLKKQKTDYEG